jgi:hypothetical protein
MGYRTTQRILTCDECKETPEDGDHMWEMCGVHVCADCIDDYSYGADEQEENK